MVATLLKMADYVLEVNTSKKLLCCWDRTHHDSHNAHCIDAAGIIKTCVQAIDSAHRGGMPAAIEYFSPELPDGHYFVLRAISNSFNLDSIFVLVEHKVLPLTGYTQTGLSEVVRSFAEMGWVTWQTNTATNLIKFSDRWKSLFGYSHEEIKTATDWTGKLHPDDLSPMLAARRKYLETKNSLFSVEVRYQCKDGSWKWVKIRTVASAFGANGKPLTYITACLDIHDRKVVEDRHRENEEFLQNLVQNLYHGLLVVNKDRKIMLSNTNFSRKYHDDDDLYLVGKDVWERLEFSKIHYKDPDEFLRRVREILDKREKVIDETLEQSDGRTYKRDYIPLFNDQNKYIGEIWMFRDITEQRRVEKKVEDQRHFYESMLNNIPAAISVIDNEDRYIFLNKKTHPDEVLRRWMYGKTDLDYCRYHKLEPEYAETRKALYDQVRTERKEVRNIEESKNEEGDIVYNLRILSPVVARSNELDFIVSYVVDVTELIKAQDALKTSMETFSGAFNHSGVGMTIISPDGYYIDANDAICQLSGYTKEELGKMHHRDFTYPDDYSLDDDLIVKLKNGEIDTYTIEKRFISKDKRIVLALLNTTLVRNRDNSPKFYVVHVQDVTEKKQLEHELYQKNQSLESARDSLLNKIIQLEEFNKIVAHNLRGPARNIEMLVNVLQSKLVETPDPKPDDFSDAFSLEETLELINKSSSALVSSLNTLMDITQIQLNKNIPLAFCDFNEEIDIVTKQLFTQIFEKNAVITRDIHLAGIDFPKAYLESILFNLLSNALKYVRPGVQPQIKISAYEMDGNKCLVVGDNGLGINLEKYGQRVFMLNQVFHKGYDSKGIGLYITKTQVESQGGTITVNSIVGEGSEFKVTFK